MSKIEALLCLSSGKWFLTREGDLFTIKGIGHDYQASVPYIESSLDELFIEYFIPALLGLKHVMTQDGIAF